MTKAISKGYYKKVTRTRAVYVSSQCAEPRTKNNTKKYNAYLNVKVFRPNAPPLPYNPGGCKPECHPSHQIQPLGVVGWGCQTLHIENRSWFKTRSPLAGSVSVGVL